jgi:UDP-glucose:(heptosyl)LPS alpha-1,3-glucosyltransferase
MKIALLRQRVTALGGAETTLGYLARGLAAAGHDVAVYGTERQATAKAALGPEVSYVRVPVWGRKTLRLLTFALNSRLLLKRDGPQMGFSLERVPGPQVYRAGDGCHREWLARRLPHLSRPARAAQSVSLFHQVMLYLEQRLFTHPALKRVIANSRQVRDEIICHYGVDPDKIRVIYNGLDRKRFFPLEPEARTDLRRRLDAPVDREIVLFVGSGFERKGLAYLFKAFAGLKNKDSLLWVVGKGDIATYQGAAIGLGMADRVKFWGPARETAPFYQAATVLVLPTIYDPCSNVVLEALACGIPVVTTAANGAAEFLRPGDHGAIIRQPDDVAGLREALANFLSRSGDPEVGLAAAQAVASLSWDATIAQTLEVLTEVASHS